MMKKRRTRLLSMVLVLAMFLTMMPMSAFAANNILAADQEVVQETLGTIGVFTNDLVQNNDSMNELARRLEDREKEEKKRASINQDIFSTGQMPSYQVNGTCGENILWNFDRDTGVLTITGTGEMLNYSNENAKQQPWRDWRNDILELNVSTNITNIGDYAFQYCMKLTKITLPDSLQSIGAGAFEGCKSITTVTFPDNLQSIGASAFARCDRLQTPKLPLGLKNIYNSAFYMCPSLETIEIPKSVKYVGLYAFDDCSNLKKVVINNEEGRIDQSAFGNCEKLERIEFGPLFKGGFGNAFANSNNIKTILGYCGDNAEWELQGSLSDGFDMTISGTGDTWESIQVFGEWSSLIQTATVESGIKNLGSGLLRNLTNLEELNISEGVQSIGNSLCQGCTNLKKVSLPKTAVTVGYSAFDECKNIETLNLGGIFPLNTDSFNDCVNISTASGYAGDVAWTMEVSEDNVLLNIFGQGAMKDLDSTYVIKTWLFECPSFEGKPVSINIEEGVSHIGARVFEDCTNIQSVRLPDSIRSIGEKAFENCTGLKNISIPSSVNNIAKNTFNNCTSLTNITIPGNVTKIGENAFSKCKNLKNVIIENGVKNIGDSAFYSCNSLNKIVIPGSVSEIESSAFLNCENLTRVTIEDGVEIIANRAFADCTNLSIVSIPASVSDLGYTVFANNKNITDIYYGGSEEQWKKIYSADNLETTTIHFNSIGPGDPGTGDTESGITSMVALFTSYDENKKQATFGATPTSYTYQITDETDLPDEGINSLIGKTVMVRYKTGDYGASDMLTCYVLSISPAVAASGILSSAEQDSIMLGDKTYSLDRANGTAALGELEDHIGDFVVCYFYDNAIVDVRFPQKQTGIFNAGTQNNVTIDSVQYPAAFSGIAPYLSAIDLWFEHTVEYWIADGIVYHVELPGYEDKYVKKLIHYDPSSRQATFQDNSLYHVSEEVTSDVTSMVNHWVTFEISTSATEGRELTDISLVKPSLKADMELRTPNKIYIQNQQYSFDDADYQASWNFKMEFDITITNVIPYAGSEELVQMKNDTSLDIQLEDIGISVPDGFKFEWTNGGDVEKISAGDSITLSAYIQPQLGEIHHESASRETITCTVKGDSGESAQTNVSFVIENLDYQEEQTEEIEDLAQEAKKALNRIDIDKAIFFSEEHSLLRDEFGMSDEQVDWFKKDILMTLALRSLSEEIVQIDIELPEIDEDTGDEIDEILDYGVKERYIDKFSLAANNYDVHLQYAFETEEFGKLTLALEFNVLDFQLDETNFSNFTTIYYEIEQEKKLPKGARTFPSDLKDGVLGMMYQYDIEAFCEAAYELAEEQIKESIYDGTVGKTANVLGNIVFLKTTNMILDAAGLSPDDMIWNLMVWHTKSSIAHCPIDVFVYDSSGKLCGSIVNNVITKEDPDNFILKVEGDSKYVLGLEDGYNIKYVATDNGTMDVEIVEESSYEQPFREINFNNIQLVKNSTYTPETPKDGNLLADSEEYYIIESNGTAEKKITSDSDEVIFGTDSDSTEEPDTPTDNEDTGGGSSFGSSSSGGSNNSNRYTVSVPSDIDNGLISVSPSSAERGDTVTITVAPDAGYKLDTLTVKDASGNAIDLTRKSDTSYTFEMPSGRVTIEATFVEIEEQPTSLPFNDVSTDDWFHDAVAYAYENGIMNGMGEDEFQPNETTNRAMVVTILYRLAGSPDLSNENLGYPFADVDASSWYGDAVYWARLNGITNGISSTNFGPDGSITREQMAALLYRYADFAGYDVSTGGMSLSEYADASEISSYAVTAMQWANENGLITGRTATALAPKGTATRAEVATILMRFCENIAS